MQNKMEVSLKRMESAIYVCGGRGSKEYSDDF